MLTPPPFFLKFGLKKGGGGEETLFSFNALCVIIVAHKICIESSPKAQTFTVLMKLVSFHFRALPVLMLRLTNLANRKTRLELSKVTELAVATKAVKCHFRLLQLASLRIKFWRKCPSRKGENTIL